MARETRQTGAGSPLEAATAAGAPLSPLARQAMGPPPTIEVRVPGRLADVVTCVARRWNVRPETAAVWLLAEGCSRLLAAVETDLLNWRDEGVPQLDFRGPDGNDDSHRLRIRLPSSELQVALGWVTKELASTRQDIGVIALSWGAARLHSTDDGHNCPIPPSGDTDPESHHEEVVSDPQQAAVLSAVPLDNSALTSLLGRSALGLLAPKQVVPLTLPAFLDDLVRCFAHRWRTPAPVTATWLVAEGASHLFAQEHLGDTSWRTGPHRWVLPTQKPQHSHQIEIPGAELQIMIGWLASRCAANQTDILGLALHVGASLWHTTHGCACGPKHTPDAGEQHQTEQAPGPS